MCVCVCVCAYVVLEFLAFRVPRDSRQKACRVPQAPHLVWHCLPELRARSVETLLLGGTGMRRRRLSWRHELGLLLGPSAVSN